METYQYIDIATIFLSIYFLLQAMIYLAGKSIFIIYILLYVFYILPLDLDYLISFPAYLNPRHHGFYISHDDALTRVIYDFALLWTQFCIIRYFKGKKIAIIAGETVAKKNYVKYLIVGMVLPPILTIVVLHNPAMLYTFQWNELDIFTIHRLFSYVEQLTYIGICCAVLYLFSDKHTKMKWVLNALALLFAYINICIQGKRGILFFALVMFFLVIFYKNNTKRDFNLFKFRNIIVVIIGLAVCFFMIAMSIDVKLERGYAEDMIVDALRIDFFRDDRVRMAIFSELYPNRMHILDWHGQTIFYNITLIWPINLICINFFGMRLLNYQQFISAAVQGIRFTGDGYMTPTLFAEGISNIGIVLGILIMPFICIWFSKQIDKYPYPLNALVIASFLLLNMFSINYIMLFLELSFILCLTSRPIKIKYITSKL